MDLDAVFRELGSHARFRIRGAAVDEHAQPNAELRDAVHPRQGAQ